MLWRGLGYRVEWVKGSVFINYWHFIYWKLTVEWQNPFLLSCRAKWPSTKNELLFQVFFKGTLTAFSQTDIYSSFYLMTALIFENQRIAIFWFLLITIWTHLSPNLNICDRFWTVKSIKNWEGVYEKQILPQIFYELWQFKIFRKYVTLGTNGLRLDSFQITLILDRQ